ncbi:MAG: hypothetical protein Hyperionvirus1_200 [Hyperionvirus sp.]|uniref:Uncharacterized protein n=1 Tax=Hyperionvirus sp. TaxID=2487770 RepID=A0A3G5A8W9_9VIRU|nr:MAG: hypothetical protein Hyperionvirus1_200 [Hyperionvirus sp.]
MNQLMIGGLDTTQKDTVMTIVSSIVCVAFIVGIILLLTNLPKKEEKGINPTGWAGIISLILSCLLCFFLVIFGFSR